MEAARGESLTYRQSHFAEADPADPSLSLAVAFAILLSICRCMTPTVRRPLKVCHIAREIESLDVIFLDIENRLHRDGERKRYFQARRPVGTVLR